MELYHFLASDIYVVANSSLFLQSPEGIQLYLELIDNNFGNSTNQLMDRFTANISSVEQQRQTYYGIFEVAVIDITTEILCETEFTGNFCEILQVFDTTTTATSSDFFSIVIATPLSTIAIVVLAIIVTALSLFVCLRQRKSKKATTSEVVSYSHGRDEAHVTLVSPYSYNSI